MSVGGCRKENLVYKLPLAKRPGLFKSKANLTNLHSCLVGNTSFVMYVKRLLTHTIP